MLQPTNIYLIQNILEHFDVLSRFSNGASLQSYIVSVGTWDQ